MDEAHGIGSGRFKDLHGEESRFSIINRHLGKVIAICEKYGFKPMIWSDMYFRIGSKNNDYYDPETVIPEEVVKQIPKGVELVYWDYYHEEKSFYADWIARHRALGSEPLMGSGIWTWNKFWYDYEYTYHTVVPCLEACREAKVKDVFFTMWGDDGGYCDYDSAFAGLAFAGELAFTGKADDCVISRKLEALFDGANYEAVLSLAKLCGMDLQRVLWDDPLMLLFMGYFRTHEVRDYNKKWNFEVMHKGLLDAAAKFNLIPLIGCAGDMVLAKCLIDAVLAKLDYADAMFKPYPSENRREAVSALLPLAVDYQKKLTAFVDIHHAMWKRHNKPFGLESIQIRLAGQKARTQELVERLREFAAGRTDVIPEMEDLMKVIKDLDLPRGSWGRLSHGTIII